MKSRGRPKTPVLTRILKLVTIGNWPATHFSLEEYAGVPDQFWPEELTKPEWLWHGAVDKNGFPTGRFGSPRVILFEKFVRPIRSGLLLEFENKLNVNPHHAQFAKAGRHLVYPYKPIDFITDEEIPPEPPTDRESALADLAEVIEEHYARRPFTSWDGYVEALREEFADVSEQDQHDALMYSGLGKLLQGEPKYVPTTNPGGSHEPEHICDTDDQA